MFPLSVIYLFSQLASFVFLGVKTFLQVVLSASSSLSLSRSRLRRRDNPFYQCVSLLDLKSNIVYKNAFILSTLVYIYVGINFTFIFTGNERREWENTRCGCSMASHNITQGIETESNQPKRERSI
ncbi:unnamed protein product [Orchesella dallaii]|uniref:Uncharacterized protein n=1 Tax=Orchesella dallaii TaxID=48710 RepID=A0ABP1PNX2_9HEXA